MPIIRVPYPNPLPTIQSDYIKQNDLLLAGFLQVNKPIWEDAANNIVQGAIFQVGGTIYYCNAATAITGTPSDYIKLTPSGDDTTVAPAYVANLTGVTWNSAYNGYYDVSGNLYVFDELNAFQDGEITLMNTKLWKALLNLIGKRKGLLEISLTGYTTTAVPTIAAGSGVEINGQYYYTDVAISITGSTANDTWYDILLTPSGTTFAASYIARGTGAWSDSKQGLYSGNNRVVACVKRIGASNFINKNILVVDNRTVKIKMEIEDWNMDADNSVAVSHGLGSDWGKIRDADFIIRNDADTAYYTSGMSSTSIAVNPQNPVGFHDTTPIDSSDIRLIRLVGELFDTTNFNSTSYNRGWIPFEYEV